MTHIDDTTIVGRIRSGSTSKKSLDNSQAVGLYARLANELHNTESDLPVE